MGTGNPISAQVRPVDTRGKSRRLSAFPARASNDPPGSGSETPAGGSIGQIASELFEIQAERTGEKGGHLTPGHGIVRTIG